MALILFADALSGNNNNSGSSEGIATTIGIDAIVTSGNKTIDLSGDSPDLSMAVSGDTIRIAGRNDGINNSDIFEIMSVNDGVDTVDVVQIPISSISGLTWAIGGAFKTIQRCIDFIDAGDTLFIKNSATYSEEINFTRNGTPVLPIILEGYGNTIGDIEIPEINGSGTLTNGITMWSPGGLEDNYYVFKNIRTTNFTNKGMNGPSARHVDCFRCRSDNNGSHGFDMRGFCSFVGCYAHNNMGHGFLTQEQNTFIACISNHNSVDGIQADEWSIAYRCLTVGNSINNIDFPVDNRKFIANCTIDGDNNTSQRGINLGNLGFGGLICLNNIIYDCQSGIVAGTTSMLTTSSIHNLLFKNSINYFNFETQFGEVLADPKFVDEPNLDYSLSSSSPAARAGFDLSQGSWFNVAAQQIDIGAFLDPVIFVETTDSFGLNSPPSLETLLLKQDHYPQIIGRFDGSESIVTIKIWDVINAVNIELVLSNINCYTIGNTGRWGWSTKYLPISNNDIQHYFYQMTSDNTQVFEGLFTLSGNLTFPSSINEYIKSI